MSDGRRTTKPKKKAAPRTRVANPEGHSDRIPLEAIMGFLDWQWNFYEGADREAITKACNAIYDHLHKDDPPEPYGN